MGVGEKTTRILDPVWGGFGDSVGEREEVKLRMELDPGLGKKEPRHVRAPSLMAQSRQSLCFPDCGQEQPLQVHRWIR